MKDYKLDDCINKLKTIECVDDRLQIIWNWMKQDHINLQQFKLLIKYYLN